MAPATRSQRRSLALSGTLNSTGFAALPNEVYLEILSFFPAYPVPKLIIWQMPNTPKRRKTILALSQTSRALRIFFLPLLWERIESVKYMDDVEDVLRGWDFSWEGGRPLSGQPLARDLLRQIETVTIREPAYAANVRVIHVDLEYQLETMLEDLLDALELLPNVQTVQLKMPPEFDPPTRKLLSSWEPKEPLKSIKALYTSYPGQQLAYHCPNLRTLGALKGEFDHIELGGLTRLLKKPLPSIERLENVTWCSTWMPTEMAEIFPNLRYFGWAIFDSFDEPLGTMVDKYPPFKDSLEAFKQLDEVNIRLDSAMWPESTWYHPKREVHDKWIAHLSKVLKEKQRKDKRTKIIRLIQTQMWPIRRPLDVEVIEVVLPLDESAVLTERTVKLQEKIDADTLPPGSEYLKMW